VVSKAHPYELDLSAIVFKKRLNSPNLIMKAPFYDANKIALLKLFGRHEIPHACESERVAHPHPAQPHLVRRTFSPGANWTSL
jgi:hypothetical protein